MPRGGRFKCDYHANLRRYDFSEIEQLITWGNDTRKWPKNRGAAHPAKLKMRLHIAMPAIEHSETKSINKNYVDCLKRFEGCTSNYCFTSHSGSTLRMRHLFCACSGGCSAGNFAMCPNAAFCGPWTQQDIVKRHRNPSQFLEIIQRQCEEKAEEPEPDAVPAPPVPAVPAPPVPPQVPPANPEAQLDAFMMGNALPVHAASPSESDGDWQPAPSARRRRRRSRPRSQPRPRRRAGRSGRR